MAKGRDRGHKEAKKPKADKKVAQAGSTFLRPKPAAAPAPTKESKEPSK